MSPFLNVVRVLGLSLIVWATLAQAQWTGVFNPAGVLAPLPASGTFPVVESTSNDLTVSGPGVHTLPSGIQAGDVLLFFMTMNSTSNYSVPAGWSASFNVVPSSSSIRLGMFYKIAVGGETTISVSTSPTSTLAQYAIMYRISGAQGTVQAATATGNSTAIGPPNLSPAWGAGNTLWIAAGVSQTTNGISGTPANYSNPIMQNLRTSQRALNAASEDPGDYTSTPSNRWVGATIAVRGN